MEIYLIVTGIFFAFIPGNGTLHLQDFGSRQDVAIFSWNFS